MNAVLREDWSGRLAATAAERAHVPAFQAPPVNVTPLDSATVQGKASCACGGGCPRCANHAVQPKLRVSSPGDQYEREADQVAEQVTRTPGAAAPNVSASAISDAKSVGHLQAKGEGGAAAGREVDAAPEINALRGGGEPLSPGAREFFEPRFGRDFGHVRVHADARAAQSALSLNARAYTIGSDIVFGAGQFAPATQGGRRLLAHELTHTIQQRSSTTAHNGLHIARQPADQPAAELAKTEPAKTEPEKKEPEKKDAAAKEPAKKEPELQFGTPRFVWDIFDDVVLKLPQRWQTAYAAGKKGGDDILFDPLLGRDLAYRQLMAIFNTFHAGMFTGMSTYKPTFSKGLEMAESLSGVTDTYLNLASMALHLDLKKYLETELPDKAISNLGWIIFYGLAVQGALVRLNLYNKEDLDFTSLLSKAAKKFTDAPRGFGRPYQLGNIPDPRWSSYQFGASPTGFGVKLSGWTDPTKPTTLSMNLGFNIASAASLYPEKEEDKAKYKGFELYPYFSFSAPVKEATKPPVIDPTAPVTAPEPRSKWMAGFFIGSEGIYTMVESGQKLGPDSKVMETYMRSGLFLRDLGPFTQIQATGEISNRPSDPAALRSRLNAATTIKVVDNASWQAILGGSLGYLFPKGDAATGGFDYGGQLSLYHKTPREGGLDPMKTGIDLGMTYRQQDPFSMGTPDLFSLKGTLSLFDFVRFSVQYNQITGENLDTALPKSDFIFMLSPGPAVFPFSKK